MDKNGRRISEDCRAVNVRSTRFRISRQNHLGMLECPGAMPAMTIHTSQFDKSAHRIIELFESTDNAEGFYMFCELGPGFISVFAGKYELSVRKRDRASLIRCEISQPRMMPVHALKRRREGCHGVAIEFFGLLFVLLEVGMIGKGTVGHRELLSSCAWTVRINQAERSLFRLCTTKVGTALSADWMRPSR